MRTKTLLTFLMLLVCFSVQARTLRRTRASRPFIATAFATRGTTDSGIQAQRGVVAADTRILPIGTEIRVRNAGPYSGTYVVADTGSKIVGRHIDIFIPNRLAARRFGRKLVQVRVIRRGNG